MNTEVIPLQAWAITVQEHVRTVSLSAAFVNTLPAIDELRRLGVTINRLAEALDDVGVRTKSGKRFSREHLHVTILRARARRRSQEGTTVAATANNSPQKTPPKRPATTESNFSNSVLPPPKELDPYKERRKGLFASPSPDDADRQTDDDDKPFDAASIFKLKGKDD